MPQPRRAAAAFSLVELAVVIALIGLLLGGVIAGKNLLYQSGMQAVVSEHNKFSTAFSQFYRQYGGLPGDINDATHYWGDDSAICSDGDTTNNGTPGTCNGNGDGDMEDTTTPLEEPYRAWQQLMLAGHIQIAASGTYASGGGAVPGTNVPVSRIRSGAAWSIGLKNATSSNADQYDVALGNFLALGTAESASHLTQAAAITPEEAFRLDSKIDNGLPGTGQVIAMKPSKLPNCASSATDASAVYNYTVARYASEPLCALNFSIRVK